MNTSHVLNDESHYSDGDLPGAELSSLRAAERRAREVAGMLEGMATDTALHRGLSAELRQLAQVTIPYQYAVLGEATQRQRAERAAREATDLARLQAMQAMQ